jgi:small-conductance mechanosensitive channel
VSFLESIDPAVWIGVGAVAGLLLHFVVFRILKHLVSRTRWQWDDLFVHHLRGPSRLVFPVGVVLFLSPAIETFESYALVRQCATLLTALALIWITLRVIDLLGAVARKRQRLDVADNLAARALVTQITVVTRTLKVFVVVIGVAAALMTIPRVQLIGTSMLASAGVAGLIVGLAARPLLENLISGLQLALTQPIRVDDVVVVQKEQGRVEEIRGTYVVVKLADERRLIVPFSKFIQEPFENWTRTSAQIVGSITFHADFSVPVETLRAELLGFVRGSKHWDERVAVLEVIDAKENGIELRASVSAPNAEALWNLRVALREHMVTFLARRRSGGPAATYGAGARDGGSNGMLAEPSRAATVDGAATEPAPAQRWRVAEPSPPLARRGNAPEDSGGGSAKSADASGTAP